MIKLITILLLLTTTVPATATPNLCKEIEAVLWEAVRDGYINEQEAIRIAGNCSLETYE
tara:strand:+ start:79 stop:255 length:177 start_codon:yes stop_codon:yes gene_type:complete